MNHQQRRLWLAAGAMSIGVGAAVTGGTAFAHADTGEPASASSSAKPRVSSGIAHKSVAAQRAAAVRRASATPKPVKTVLPVDLSVVEDALAGAATRESTARSPRVQAARTSASAIPTLPSVGAIIPRLFNVLVPLINNTPIRDVLNLVDPQGTRGATVVRLPGVPSSSVLSPNGKLLFELTVPRNPLALLGYVPPRYSTLTEISTGTNTVVGVPINVRGVPIGAPVVSADGTRAYQTSSITNGSTNVTYLTVIDTSHDTVVGKPIRLDGWAAGGVVLSADGRRAYQSTSTTVDGQSTTTISAIDTTSVATVGNRLTLQGFQLGSMVRSPDGTRLCVVVEPTSSSTTTVNLAVIDTAGMSLVGQPISLAGSLNGNVAVSPDGTRAAVTTNTTGASSAVTVTLVDLADGTVVGTPTVIDGSSSSANAAAIFSDGGARVSQVTASQSSGGALTLTVIDSSTGALVGTPISLPGTGTYFTTMVVPDPAGARLFVASGVENPTTWNYDSTSITVVDTADGTVVGTPVTVAAYGSTVAGPDGDSVYISAEVGETSQVSAVNSDSSRTGTSPTLNGQPVKLLVNQGGSWVYQLTEVGSHTQVIALDADTIDTAGATASVNGVLDNALITPDGREIYGTNHGSSWLMSLLFPYRVTAVKTSAIR